MKKTYSYLPLKVEKYEIQSSKLPKNFDGCRIVFLTDLHSNLYGKENRKLIKKIEEINPDYIMCTGDMIVGKQDCDTQVALNLFQILARKWEIFYSLGNHEQKLLSYTKSGDTSFYEYIGGLKRFGIHILDNETYCLKRGQDEIDITGVTIDYKYHCKVWKREKMEVSYMREIVNTVNKKRYQLLLAHNPEHIKSYAKWGADLVLSGHIHGGIMILPKIGGVIAPSYELFPKYDFGRFTEKNCEMILSRGLGTHTIRFRIFNNPEISVITLKSL